jgi:hypothetical protein
LTEYRKPNWHPGDQEEFEQDVGSLEPHHCSYPDGQIESVEGGSCCRGQKTYSGVCQDHVPELLPMLHRHGLTMHERRELSEGLHDPRLASMAVNIVYAEKFLNVKYVNLLRGGVSGKFAEDLAALIEKIGKLNRQWQDSLNESNQCTVKMNEALAAEDEKKAKQYEKLRADHFNDFVDTKNKLNELIDEVEVEAMMASNQNRLWKELQEANDHSLRVKTGVLDSDNRRRDSIGIEEANRAFVSLVGIMENACRKLLPASQAEAVMKEIVIEASSVRGVISGGSG